MSSHLQLFCVICKRWELKKTPNLLTAMYRQKKKKKEGGVKKTLKPKKSDIVQTSACLKNVRIFFLMSCLEQSLAKVCMFWLIDRYPESLLPLFLVIYLLKKLDSLVSYRSFWILLLEFLWCQLTCSCVLIFCILVVKYRDLVRFKLNFFGKTISLWWCETHNTWWSLFVMITAIVIILTSLLRCNLHTIKTPISCKIQWFFFSKFFELCNNHCYGVGEHFCLLSKINLIPIYITLSPILQCNLFCLDRFFFAFSGYSI